jgi:putative transposase
MASSSKTFLLYHIIFSTKKRQKTINVDFKSRLHEYMAGIIKQKKGMPIMINGTEDHVHILAFLPRHISLSEMIQAIKGGSSFWYNKEYSQNSLKLSWQEGYQVISVSPGLLEPVKNYIFKQEEHHQKVNYSQEMEEFERELRKHYDPDKWERKAKEG